MASDAMAVLLDTSKSEPERRKEKFVLVHDEKFDISDDQLLSCDQCDQQFVSDVLFQKHQANHQLMQSSFTCQSCHRETSSESDLQQHVKTHLGEMPYVCEMCGKGFERRYSYRCHYRTHTGEKPYTCEICGKQFAFSSGLRYHERTHSGKNCGIRVGGKSPEEANRVKDCDGEILTDIHPLPGFVNLKSKSKSPQDSTAKSQGKSPGKSNASTDVSVTRIEKKQTPLSYSEDTECMICGKRFQYLFILESHLRAHSAEEIDHTIKMFHCSNDEDSLEISASWKPYACEECGYECCTSYELRTHTLSHSTETPHKTFSSGSELETHFKEHSSMLGPIEFTCPICARTFKKKYNWQIHMKTHTGERDYFCHFCSRTFWRKYNWKIHMKTHTGERAYSCHYCPKSFITSSRLKFHMKSKHSNVRLYKVNTAVSGNLRNRMQNSDVRVAGIDDASDNGDDEVLPRRPSKLSQEPRRNCTEAAIKTKKKHGDPDTILAMQTLTEAEQPDGGSETADLCDAIAEPMKKSSYVSPFMRPSGKGSIESVPPSSSEKEITEPYTANVQDTPESDGTLGQRRNRNNPKPSSHGIKVMTKTTEKAKPVESGSKADDDIVISLDSVSSGQIPDDVPAKEDNEICDAFDSKMNSSTVKEEQMLDSRSRDENMMDIIMNMIDDNGMYYSCRICSFKFATQETLRKHENLHPKETPFECIECGLGFMYATDLQVHRLVHKSKNPYECLYCGKCFEKSDNLKSHVRTHTSESQYKCEICDRRFTTSIGLRCHERNRKTENCYRYRYEPYYQNSHIMTYPTMEIREDIAKEGKSQIDLATEGKSQEDSAMEGKSQEDIAKEGKSEEDIAKRILPRRGRAKRKLPRRRRAKRILPRRI
ncbi:zinc finger protein Xfin-like [Haliotis rufescens]|uniref:zinc finger protein Xfin-like n=1 Tax=Haliotis rufescens TaxID=6454 RepID=UPI00201EE1AA|nr:zinc finger protein Xfin-like [Haliotis rufescens]XP_046354671.2 zinc finger protein Xfin-like [Haliotis rufescens]